MTEFRVHDTTFKTEQAGYKVRRIKRNAIQCLDCQDVIHSRHRHDFVSCKCGAVFVDGGVDYLRRGGDLAKIKDLSEYYGD